MNINVLSKYIILFLLAVLVVLSVLLAIYSAENKALQKANAVLKEQVALRDAAISEIDKNIASLQEQVKEAEKICDERLKARNDLLTFLSIEPAYDVSKNGTFFPQTPACAVSNSSLFGRETGSRRCETLPSFNIDLHNGSKKNSVAGGATELNKKNIDSSLFVNTNIQNDSGVGSAAHNNKRGIYEVISKTKSDYAVNSINNYISMFTTLASDNKK